MLRDAKSIWRIYFKNIQVTSSDIEYITWIMSQCLINFTFLSLRNCHGLLAQSSLSLDSPEFTMFDTFDTQAGTVVHISLRLPCNYLHSTYGHILQHTSMIQWYRLLCVGCVRCHVQTAVFSAWSDDRCHGLRSQCLKPSQLGVHFMHFFHAMIRHENHVMSFHTHPHVSWLLNWAQIAPSLVSGSHTILAGALNGAPCFAFGFFEEFSVFCSAWQIHWLNDCPIAYCKNSQKICECILCILCELALLVFPSLSEVLLGNRWKCQEDLPQESRSPWWPGLAKINHSSGLNLILFFANDSMKQWKMMNKIINYVVFYDILCIWCILCIVSRSDSSFDLPRLSPLSPRLPLPHFGSPCWWLPSNFGDLVGQLSKRLSINVHSCP